jgi:hypothetical protein
MAALVEEQRRMILGAGRSAVERVDVVDAEIRDVAVIADRGRCGRVRAAAEHEGDVARATEAPVSWLDVVEFATKDVPVPGAGYVQVLYCQDRV